MSQYPVFERMTVEQRGRLILKSRSEPRRNQKRFLKDLGGDGSAEELDAVLTAVLNDPAAVTEADRLGRMRDLAAKSVELGLDGRVAELLAEIRVRISEKGLSQSEIASRCGWPDSLLSAYLTGQKSPGIGNLVKIASSLGCQWRLIDDSQSH